MVYTPDVKQFMSFKLKSVSQSGKKGRREVPLWSNSFFLNILSKQLDIFEGGIIWSSFSTESFSLHTGKKPRERTHSQYLEKGVKPGLLLLTPHNGLLAHLKKVDERRVRFHQLSGLTGKTAGCYKENAR